MDQNERSRPGKDGDHLVTCSSTSKGKKFVVDSQILTIGGGTTNE